MKLTLIFLGLILTVKLNSQCSPGFIYSLSANNIVSFTSTSAVPPGTNYTWAFGDGTIATNSTAVHTYSAGGVYAVTLSIASGTSCNASTSQTIGVASNCSVVPNFVFTVNPGGNVNFSNASINTNSLTFYTCMMDDGASYYNILPLTHTYTNNAIYNVNLLVHDSLNGCYVSITKTISVSGLPCTVNSNFTINSQTISNPTYSNTVQFSNLSTPVNVSHLFNYSWNFGVAGSSTLQNPSIIYNSPGVKTVTLFAAEGTGTCVSVHTDTFSALPCTLTANFTHTVLPNGQVNFTNLSNNTTNVSWNFGDGTSNNTINPTHNYFNNGNYIVSLTILDSIPFIFQNLCQSTHSVMIPVNKVTCAIQAYASIVNFNSAINNTQYAASCNNCTNTVNYTWSFGNGGTSNIQNGIYTYTNNGTYTTTVVISYPSIPSCSMSISNTISIFCANSNLNANFTFSVGLNGAVTFSNLSTSNSTFVYCDWQFGDGTTITSNSITNVSHSYSLNGTFNV